MGAGDNFKWVYINSFAITAADPHKVGPLAIGNDYLMYPGVLDGSFTVTSIKSPLASFHSSVTQSAYKELGKALGELVKIEGELEDEDSLNSEVYQVACAIAEKLRESNYPAPTIFRHHASAVVFNWAILAKNCYLTVSADKVSALVSTPEKIGARKTLEVRDLLSTPEVLPLMLSSGDTTPLTWRSNLVSHA